MKNPPQASGPQPSIDDADDDYQLSLFLDVATDKYMLVHQKLSADFGLQDIESLDLTAEIESKKVA